MFDVSCPNCKSENTQAIQVLLAAGTAQGSFRGAGVGVSQGGGLGGGIMGGTTSQATNLVRRFAPGARPRAKVGMLLWGIVLGSTGVAMFFPGSFGGGGSAVGCGGAFGAMGAVLLGIYTFDLASLKKRQARWDQRSHYLRQAWFCHRCGADWIPGQPQV